MAEITADPAVWSRSWPTALAREAFSRAARGRLDDLAELERRLGLPGPVAERGRGLADALEAGNAPTAGAWPWQDLIVRGAEDARRSRLDWATERPVADSVA